MQPNNYNWFDLNFPWIGLMGATLMLALLFGTDLLSGNRENPRWKDITWLSWLGFTAYLIHNGEEYGIDLYGHTHAFPEQFCTTLTKALGITDCSVPPLFFLAVNITLFWIIVPVGAMLSRRYPLAGLSIYSVIFINGLVHIIPLLLGKGYGPGAFTALIIFLPLSVWVGYACFGKGKLPYKSMFALIILGLILHAILMGSVVAFLTGKITAMLLILIQIVNALLLLLLSLRWIKL